jgi:hypothetical protein
MAGTMQIASAGTKHMVVSEQYAATFFRDGLMKCQFGKPLLIG